MLSKTEAVISYNHEIEAERAKRRQAVSEVDTMKFKISCLEDDLQKQILDNDKQAKCIDVLNHEKLSIANLMKEKELMIDSLKRQINEKSETIRERDLEIETVIKRKSDQQ